MGYWMQVGEGSVQSDGTITFTLDVADPNLKTFKMRPSVETE